MTIDEAIKHYEEMAGVNKCAAEMLSDDAFLHTDLEYIKECREEAIASVELSREYMQLAAWLTELKEAKKFIRKLQNELLKGTSFYSTSFLKENRELMDELTKGVECLDD